MSNNNELKCTGGNWDIDPVLPTVVRLSPYARVEQTLEVENCSPTDYYIFTSESGEAEANAHLIAASKDLYEALLKAERTIEQLAGELNYTSKRWCSEHIIPIHKALLKANPNYKP